MQAEFVGVVEIGNIEAMSCFFDVCLHWDAQTPKEKMRAALFEVNNMSVKKMMTCMGNRLRHAYYMALCGLISCRIRKISCEV